MKKNRGVRPKTIRGLFAEKVKRPNHDNSIRAGPRVISRKSSDGGYLLHRRNESTVMPEIDEDHGRGSPYALIPRTTRKPSVNPSPMRNVHMRCRAGSSIMIRPKQKPAAITPIQGTSG